MSEDLLLLCLAALGGIFAVAWGSRRIGVPDGDAMVDARTQLQVRLDALRARAILLRRHPEVTDTGLARIDGVIEKQLTIQGDTEKAGTAEDIRALESQLAGAFLTLEQVGRQMGVDAPADLPFAGLCHFDPQHGAAESSTSAGNAVCTRCAAALADGEDLRQRQVADGGRPVPFTAIAERSEMV